MNELPAPDPGALPITCRYTITVNQFGNASADYATLPRAAFDLLEELKDMSPDSYFSGTLRLDIPPKPDDPKSKTTMVWTWTRRLLHGF